jgi:hypothetical protein
MSVKKHYFPDRNLLVLAIQKVIKPVQVVLDIGCGIQPQNYITPAVHICCEPFGDYIEYLQHEIREQKRINLIDRAYIFLNATWSEMTGYFPERSVDTVFLLDVIEHLDKEQGRELLAWVEKIARCQVVIFTPLGFVKQEHPDGKDAWGMDGGNWQVHKSGWVPEDFDETWQTYVTERFHYETNLGDPYAVPAGAFYAIKTISDFSPAVKPGFHTLFWSSFYKSVNTVRMLMEASPFYEVVRKKYRSFFPKKQKAYLHNKKDE